MPSLKCYRSGKEEERERKNVWGLHAPNTCSFLERILWSRSFAHVLPLSGTVFRSSEELLHYLWSLPLPQLTPGISWDVLWLKYGPMNAFKCTDSSFMDTRCFQIKKKQFIRYWGIASPQLSVVCFGRKKSSRTKIRRSSWTLTNIFWENCSIFQKYKLALKNLIIATRPLKNVEVLTCSWLKR